MWKSIFLLFCVLSLTACSALFSNYPQRNTISSSLVDYLYPDEKSRKNHTSQIPLLKLPVKVGLAFVPSNNSHYGGINSSNQIELLNKVKQSFNQYDFIDEIEIIPSAYLANGQGFETLEQVQRLYDIDLMALVSYDQVSQTHENTAALFYWTIVGMYVIPGNDNQVQTFVDTAVFDIKTRSMLFRAPGISKLEKRTAAVNVEETIARKSFQGFDMAVQDMTKNLDTELARFKQRVKEEEVAKVEYREGYKGAGSLTLLSIFMIGLFGFIRVRNIQ